MTRCIILEAYVWSKKELMTSLWKLERIVEVEVYMVESNQYDRKKVAHDILIESMKKTTEVEVYMIGRKSSSMIKDRKKEIIRHHH